MYLTYILAVVILHLAVLVGQTLVLLPGVHPVPGQPAQVVTLVLELELRQTGSLTTQWADQGDQGDVVTSEIPVGAASFVRVAVSDSAPDLTELSPLETVLVVHVLHPQEDGTPRLQREDLDILDRLPALSGDQGLTLHLDVVIGVGSSSPALSEADIILGFSVHFLGDEVKVTEDRSGLVVTLMYMVQWAAERTILGVIRTPVHSIHPTQRSYGSVACCNSPVIMIGITQHMA